MAMVAGDHVFTPERTILDWASVRIRECLCFPLSAAVAAGVAVAAVGAAAAAAGVTLSDLLALSIPRSLRGFLANWGLGTRL